MHLAGDTARRLTTDGHFQAQGSARWIRELCMRQDWIPRLISSPAVRAQQTASTLSQLTFWPIHTEPRIAPGQDSGIFMECLFETDADCLIMVGHQPTLGQVASYLLPDRSPWIITKSSVWWLECLSQSGDTLLHSSYIPD